jgi:hypothetical protein
MRATLAVMVQPWKVIALLGLVSSGCLWERNIDSRMARLQAGVTTRRVVTRAPEQPIGGTVARTTTPPDLTEQVPQVSSYGVTGSMQFTMRMLKHVYAGGELEAGPMERTGSYLGGAYGVAGAEVSSPRGTLSVEMNAGRRWIRYELGAENVPHNVLEPRVRGQLFLTPQVTLGGMIGASVMPEERGWMAGVYVGLYSLDMK